MAADASALHLLGWQQKLPERTCTPPCAHGRCTCARQRPSCVRPGQAAPRRPCPCVGVSISSVPSTSVPSVKPSSSLQRRRPVEATMPTPYWRRRRRAVSLQAPSQRLELFSPAIRPRVAFCGPWGSPRHHHRPPSQAKRWRAPPQLAVRAGFNGPPGARDGRRQLCRGARLLANRRRQPAAATPAAAVARHCRRPSFSRRMQSWRSERSCS